MPESKRIVLAYSGGLDTSVILHWLVAQGYEVITYTADLGQDENMEEAVAKAYQGGAQQAYVVDLKEEFVTDFISRLYGLMQSMRGDTLWAPPSLAH